MVVPSTHRAWVRHLTSLVLAWNLIVGFLRVADADCAAGSTTLTTSGCSACNAFALCRGFDVAANCLGPNCQTLGNCTYECLNVDQTAQTLVVLVEFGAYQSDQEEAAGGYSDKDLTNYPDETKEWPSVSNDQVTALGLINLSSKVSALLLDYNYLTSVSMKDGISSITTLYGKMFISCPLTEFNANTFVFQPRSLENNNIHTFNGIFPNLEQLYDLSNQFEKIAMIDFNGDVPCDDIDQRRLHGVVVCITDGTTDGESASPSTSTPVDGLDMKNSTSAYSSWMTVLLAILYGVAGVLMVVIIIMVNQQKRKRTRRRDGDGTVEYSRHHSCSQESDRSQVKRALQTGSGIALHSSNISMGIPTLGSRDEDDLPVLEDSRHRTSKYALHVTTAKAALKVRQDRRMSVWNDYELLSLQLCASSIKDIKQLSRGGYATVWLVRYRNLQLLASKRLRPEKRTQKNTAAFVEEIKLAANFDHPNLVKLVGAAWTMGSDLQMLLEYMDGGDLQSYLADPLTPTGWTSQKFSIALDVIEALVYFHSFVPPLLHRDIKSKNVLLSTKLKAKLGDFGKARFLSNDHSMTAGVGTRRWLAPEVIRGDANYGRPADIYSFGVLLTELDTNEIPYSSTRGPNGKVMSERTIMRQYMYAVKVGLHFTMLEISVCAPQRKTCGRHKKYACRLDTLSTVYCTNTRSKCRSTTDRDLRTCEALSSSLHKQISLWTSGESVKAAGALGKDSGATSPSAANNADRVDAMLAMELSLEDQELCRDLTMQLLDRTLYDCEELGLGTTHTGGHADLNGRRWKKLQSHPDVTLYADRSPGSAWLPVMNRGDWEQPVALVTVGHVNCSLDDLLLALLSPNVATIRLRGVLMGRRPETNLKLVPIVRPSIASPFEFLGVAQFVNTQHWPLTMFVGPREMVLALATGEVITANGRRFGYEIILSVPLYKNSSMPRT
ncbi:unnamed protein product [Phytophthora lilii]|uniref:Unnamed protein product n=1 Tax=Phytophthora lilii TaxID=2077276 RepID=A0A9W6TPF6_9STRA|nr:unnamed protein product [Phytophthora lilii]